MYNNLHFLFVRLTCNVMLLILRHMASTNNNNGLLYDNTTNPMIDFINKKYNI